MSQWEHERQPGYLAAWKQIGLNQFHPPQPWHVRWSERTRGFFRAVGAVARGLRIDHRAARTKEVIRKQSDTSKEQYGEVVSVEMR